MTGNPAHRLEAEPRPPRTTCNTSPGMVISTQLVLLFVAQAGLIALLVLVCGMAPAAAAGLCVAVLAGDVHAATANVGRLKALARHLPNTGGTPARWYP